MGNESAVKKRGRRQVKGATYHQVEKGRSLSWNNDGLALGMAADVL